MPTCGDPTDELPSVPGNAAKALGASEGGPIGATYPTVQRLDEGLRVGTRTRLAQQIASKAELLFGVAAAFLRVGLLVEVPQDRYGSNLVFGTHHCRLEPTKRRANLRQEERYFAACACSLAFCCCPSLL